MEHDDERARRKSALPAKPRPRRRWLRRLARLVLLVIGLSVVAWFTRAAWLRPLATRVLAHALHAQVSIGVFECGDPRAIEVRELHVRSDDGSWSADVDVLRARLDPWLLLRGRAPQLLRLEVDGASLAFERPASDSGGAAFVLPPLPSELPALQLARVDLRVRIDEQRAVVLDGLALETAGTPGPVRVAAGRLALRDPQWGFEASDLAADLSLTRDALRIASVRCGERELARDGSLELAHLAEPRAAFQVELPELDTRLSGAFDRDSLSVRADCTALELAHLPELALRQLPADLHGLMHGSCALWLPFAAPTARVVDARLTLISPCIAGRALDQLAFDGAVAGSTCFVATLDAQRGADRLSARGLEFSIDSTDARSWLREARGALDLDVRDLPSLAAPWVQVGSETLPAHHLAARVRLDERGATIESARLSTAGGTFVVRRGSLIFDGASTPADARADLAQLFQDARIDLDAAVDFDDLATLGALVSTRPWSGSLRGSVRLAGRAREARGNASLRAKDVVIDGLGLGQAEIEARIEAQRIELSTLHALTPYGALDAHGAFDLRTREFDDLVFDLRTDAALHEWNPSFASGATQVSGRLSGPLAAPRGELRLDVAELRSGSLSIENLALRSRAQDGRWTIDSLSACSGDVDVQVSGSLAFERSTNALDAELASLTVAYGPSSLALEAPVAVHVARERISIAPFALSGNAGRVRGQLEHAAGNWEGRLTLEQLGDLGLATWVPGWELACDDVSGSISIRGGGSSLDARVRLDAGRVNCAGTQDPNDDLGFHLRARWTDARLSINTLSLESQRDHVRIAGSLPLDAGAWPDAGSAARATDTLLRGGPIELHADWDVAELATLPVRLLPPLERLRGRARGALDLDGTWDAPRVSCALDFEELQETWPASESSAELSTPAAQLGPFDGHIELELAEELACRGLKVSGPGGLSLELDGTLAAPFRPREWLARNAASPPSDFEEELEHATIALHARARADDLAPFSGRIPAVRRSSGEFTLDLELAGTLAQPELAGTASVRGGELRLTEEIPPLSALAGNVSFAGRTATLESFTGNLGAGPFQLAGKLDWSDPALLVHLELKGEELLLARTPNLRLRADAQLTFDGPLGTTASATPPTLRGELQLRDSRYARDFDLLEPLRHAGRGRPSTGRREIGFFSLTSEPLASTELRVQVRGDSFKIVNNLLRASLRPELEISGTGAAPELAGDLYLERGAFVLPAGVVELRSGRVSFDRRDPLVPQLDLRGEARFSGYDVALSARGPYDDLDILLSSTPVLSSSDLMLLSLSGRAPSEGQGSDSAQQTAQSLAAFLGRDYLTRTLRDESGSTDSLWSRIEFRQGREVTKSGGQTSELSLDLTGRDEFGRSSDAPRAIYLRAERDAYDRANFGVRFVFRRP